MKRLPAMFFLFVIVLVLFSGCTQSSPAPVPQPDQTPAAPAQTQPPAADTTPAAPAGIATSRAPVETVTIIHYIVPVKAWKDTELHFSFEAPQDWAVTTRQLELPDGSQGLEFQTDLVSDNVFYIRTFPISRNQDQDYRNIFRTWDPKPAESTVTYKSIVYDRFESAKNGTTQVGYVARKSSANDLGYSSVIYFIADDAKPFEKEDFDTVVASFTYVTKDRVATLQGEEIPRVR